MQRGRADPQPPGCRPSPQRRRRRRSQGRGICRVPRCRGLPRRPPDRAQWAHRAGRANRMNRPRRISAPHRSSPAKATSVARRVRSQRQAWRMPRRRQLRPSTKRALAWHTLRPRRPQPRRRMSRQHQHAPAASKPPANPRQTRCMVRCAWGRSRRPRTHHLPRRRVRRRRCMSRRMPPLRRR